ncbi:hypothetical protein BDN72DRAFT_554476 [Pluteus cervinus]|uniref:Uncharacterized protein n=1 Tax=Pluteus cervinus TaxID=181527 RepID=A0ACD3AWS4_9AGAR|nr:hypothetical protein BDN72DRAFT_554476 [Pluteus cervinus]
MSSILKSRNHTSQAQLVCSCSLQFIFASRMLPMMIIIHPTARDPMVNFATEMVLKARSLAVTSNIVWTLFAHLGDTCPMSSRVGFYPRTFSLKLSLPTGPQKHLDRTVR